MTAGATSTAIARMTAALAVYIYGPDPGYGAYPGCAAAGARRAHCQKCRRNPFLDAGSSGLWRRSPAHC